MERVPILTLTTDFGNDGPYVAALKGVVLGLAPRTQIVDVTHAIAPQNVLEGAFVMAEVVDSFPPGTVHMGVVDPGVGTDRALIALGVAGQWFVVPDNGLISGVTRSRRPTGAWELANPTLRLPRVSDTFHGRDILAPAAAHLLLGGAPEALGPRETWVTLRNLRPTPDGDGGWVGEVIFRDVFGNLITNVAAEHLAGAPGEGWAVEVAGESLGSIARTYGDHPSGSLIALLGGTGWLEVAVANGDAARRLSVGPGATVRVRSSVAAGHLP